MEVIKISSIIYSQLTQLSTTPKYKDKLLIPIKDKLLPISLKDVSCFYTADKNTYVYLKSGNSYPYAKHWNR